MDAFFAAIEQRDNPELVGKPVVIARNPRETGGRGVVSTASYEARKFGIHSAMSSKEAYDRHPQAIFISGNYDKYTEVSKQVKEIFTRYTNKIQMASIDEAYLDVTENKVGSHSALKIAQMIQYDIYHELKLTCSAGVSYNKFLAKIASDWKKPRGLTLIRPEEALDFLYHLPVEKFHGVGKATLPKLHDLGIQMGGDLQESDPLELTERFGVYGWSLWLKANGIHNSKVTDLRQRKSIGKERTYGKLLHLEEDIKKELDKLSNRVAGSMQRMSIKGKIVVIKIRYEDFSTFTRRKMVSDQFDSEENLSRIARDIFDSLDYDGAGIRLLGVTVTGFGQRAISLEEGLEDRP